MTHVVERKPDTDDLIVGNVAYVMMQCYLGLIVICYIKSYEHGLGQLWKMLYMHM